MSDYNDFENSGTSYAGGGYNAYGRGGGWYYFSIEDESFARKRFSRFFLSVFLYLLISNIAAIASTFILRLALGAEAAEAVFNSPYFVLLLNVVCMYVIALPVLLLIVKGLPRTFRTKGKMKVSEFLVTFLVAEALMLVGNIIGNTLNSFIGAITGYMPENSVDEILKAPIWLIILVVVIIGPIVEELIFRKLLMDKLGIYGDRIAIVVSAIAFGIFHGNFYQLFYATLLGFVLAYMYSKSGNILYPTLMHMLLNFCGSIIPILIMPYMDKLTEIMESTQEGAALNSVEYFTALSVVGTYAFIQYGIAIAGAIILFKFRQRIFVSDRCDVYIPKNRIAAVTLGNVGVILFLVFCIITMGINLIPFDAILSGLGGANG